MKILMHTIKSFRTKPIGWLASYLLNKYWPRKYQYALHIHIGEANVLSKHDIKMYLASHIFIRSNPMWRCFSNYGFWIDKLWISSTRKPRKTRQRPPWGMSNLLIYFFFPPWVENFHICEGKWWDCIITYSNSIFQFNYMHR